MSATPKQRLRWASSCYAWLRAGPIWRPLVSLGLPAAGLVVGLALVLSGNKDSPASTARGPAEPITTSVSESTGPVYRNRTWGWSVSYPRGWQVNSTDPAVVSLVPPPNLPPALVAINSGRRPPLISRTELLNALVRSYEESLDQSGVRFQRLSTRQFTLSERYPAAEVIYDLEAADQPGRARLVIITTTGSVFTINAETDRDSFSALEAQFNLIVNSFAPSP